MDEKNRWQGVPVDPKDIEEIEDQETIKPEGLGGWLVVFLIYLLMLALGIPLLIWAVVRSYSTAELFVIISILGVLLSFIYIAVFILILLKDKRFRLVYMIAVAATFVFGLFSGIPYIEIFWLVYLNRSERVKNTFHR